MSIVRGLPEELRMNSVSLPDSVQSYQVKVVPQNVTSISSVGSASVTANAGSCFEVSMPSQQIIFDIPTVASPNTWVDCAKSTFSFRAKYSVTSGSTRFDNGALKGALRSCAWAYFNRIFHTSSSGTIVDDCPLTNLANHHHLQYNYDAAEIDSTALSWGFDFEDYDDTAYNANNGHPIHNINTTPALSTSTDSYYSYDFPLPSSVLGKFCKGMFPIGKVSKLTLTLQTDSVAPITIQCATATSGATASVSVTIDQFAINMHYVDLGEEGGRLLGGGSSAVVHGVTHRVSQSTLASGITGGVSVLMGLRGSSVRSLALRVQDGGSGSTAVSANGIYDSKSLLANSIAYYLNSKERVPPNPYNNITQPASVFMKALHASEAFAERQLKFNGTPNEFLTRCASSTPPSAATHQADQRLINAGNVTDANFLASWCFAVPLQKVSKSKILDGANFNSSNQYFEANLQIASTNSLLLSFIAEMDIIFVISDGDIQVRS